MLVSLPSLQQRLFGGKQDPCHKVQKNSCTPEENESCPDYPDDIGVNIKVFPYAPTNSSKQPVSLRAIKNLVLFHGVKKSDCKNLL